MNKLINKSTNFASLPPSSFILRVLITFAQQRRAYADKQDQDGVCPHVCKVEFFLIHNSCGPTRSLLIIKNCDPEGRFTLDEPCFRYWRRRVNTRVSISNCRDHAEVYSALSAAGRLKRGLPKGSQTHQLRSISSLVGSCQFSSLIGM